jgi:hypothetical protein
MNHHRPAHMVVEILHQDTASAGSVCVLGHGTRQLHVFDQAPDRHDWPGWMFTATRTTSSA